MRHRWDKFMRGKSIATHYQGYLWQHNPLIYRCRFCGALKFYYGDYCELHRVAYKEAFTKGFQVLKHIPNCVPFTPVGA